MKGEADGRGEVLRADWPDEFVRPVGRPWPVVYPDEVLDPVESDAAVRVSEFEARIEALRVETNQMMAAFRVDLVREQGRGNVTRRVEPVRVEPSGFPVAALVMLALVTVLGVFVLVLLAPGVPVVAGVAASVVVVWLGGLGVVLCSVESRCV